MGQERDDETYKSWSGFLSDGSIRDSWYGNGGYSADRREECSQAGRTGAGLPAQRFGRSPGHAIGLSWQGGAAEFLGNLVRPLPGGDAGDGAALSDLSTERL